MSLDKWKTGRFKLPGMRPGVMLAGIDGVPYLSPVS